MSRYRQQSSYAHRVRRFSFGYRLYWTVDRYYEGSRLRWPTEYSRDTDEAGARRFCKRWGIEFPEEEKDTR